MKKVIFTQVIVFLSLFALSQNNGTDIRGTMKKTSSTTVMLSIKPTNSVTGAFTNAFFTVQIPTSYTPMPNVTIKSCPLSSNPALTANMLVQGDFTQVFTGIDGSYYTYVFGTPNLTGKPVGTLVGGTEYDALELQISGTTIDPLTMRFVNLAYGGSTNQGSFYLEINGDAMDYNTPFYSTAGATVFNDPHPGDYSTTSWVIAGNVLPVKWLSFDIQKQNKDAKLAWNVAEENNDHFEIERSYSGSGFEKIATVAGASGPMSTQSYSFSDMNIGAKTGVAYYRIKQVDVDGKSSYSPIRKLNFTNAIIHSLYPNPVSNGFYLEVKNQENAKLTMRLTNMTGQVVDVRNIEESILYYDMKGKGLATGNYVVNVFNGNELLDTKTIVFSQTK